MSPLRTTGTQTMYAEQPNGPSFPSGRGERSSVKINLRIEWIFHKINIRIEMDIPQQASSKQEHPACLRC
eukprot:6016672-Amphidinium_carterae.1